jgi:predicted 3-demethylubiquinone-9 3-methyltransferase (glyoxalase superfamily)
MKKITPHLWFDKEAKEAAEFYASVFSAGDSRVRSVSKLNDTPSGSVDIVSLELCGQPFSMISAGPLFKFNPSVSFLVACSTKDEVDGIWAKLSQGGTARIPIGEYPFSRRYGWTQDRYGVSWQVMLSDRPIKQKITPTLMFVGNVCGKAEEAIKFYASVFHNSAVGEVFRYGKADAPDKKGAVKFAPFTLDGNEFAAMDSARSHNFGFNEAISFIVNCDTQQEIDYYWSKLSAVPSAEQCGWLKDTYGLSWQIVPSMMNEMLGSKDQKRIARLTQAFLKMKKFDIEALKRAWEQ